MARFLIALLFGLTIALVAPVGAQIRADASGTIVVLDTSTVVRVLPLPPYTIDSVRIWAGDEPITGPLRLAQGGSVQLRPRIFWTADRVPPSHTVELIYGVYNCAEDRPALCALDSTFVDVDTAGVVQVIGAGADSLDVRIGVAVIVRGVNEPPRPGQDPPDAPTRNVAAGVGVLALAAAGLSLRRHRRGAR